jgi:hypothetical protein
MKALISPNEVFTWTWVTSWKQEAGKWVPDTTDSITNCQRVAQVELDDKVFEVAQPLYWFDCPENCVADEWYFKDNQVQPKPQDVPRPQPE